MFNNLSKILIVQNSKNLVRIFSQHQFAVGKSSIIRNYLLDLNNTIKFNKQKQFYSKVYIKGITNRDNMAEKPKVVFVLGGPGAGKGTQCQKIVDEFDFVHLSAGDLLRAERSRKGSEFGDMIEECIRNGKIVPVEVTCSLIDKAMEDSMKESGKCKFLIDGFPRNQDNLDGWNRAMSEKVDFMFVLFFDCDQKICIDRCLERGKAGSGRSDDNEDSMKKRISTYTNDSLPIIEHYRKLNKVRQIDAAPEPDIVFQFVKHAFNKASGDTN